MVLVVADLVVDRAQVGGHLGQLALDPPRWALSRASRSASLPAPARTRSAYFLTSRIGMPVARSLVIRVIHETSCSE